MNKRHLMRGAAALLLAATLGACGGGGGSPGTTGSGAEALPSPATMLTLDVRNASGLVVSTLSGNDVAYARALVTDGNGVPVTSQSVTFTATNGLVAFSPASGVVQTDGTGTATVSIRSAASTSQGSASITATTTVDGQEAKDTIDILVVPG